MMNKIFFCLLACTVFLCSCSKKNFSNKPTYQFKSTDGRPDYLDMHYWAAHPLKWDPSDSVPKPLRKNFVKDSVADVFFIYPTSLTDPKNKSSNAAIDDAFINSKTDYSSILYQASAFNEQCRVFAPRYRQAHYGNYFTADTASARKAFDLAYEDVKTAFETYLTYYNGGRPIIIASHSQGTTHAARLLKEFFENKTLKNKLICAYIIGMPIPENYFTTLKPCKDSLSTGCFVAWRTFEKNYEGTSFVLAENYKAVVVNPLSWTTDTSVAASSLNKGAVLKNFNKLVPHVTNAQVHGNILWATKPKFFGSFLLKTKNYHIADINFYYLNIRENVKRRIMMYWKN
jgi:hypothetical protein